MLSYFSTLSWIYPSIEWEAETVFPRNLNATTHSDETEKIIECEKVVCNKSPQLLDIEATTTLYAAI